MDSIRDVLSRLGLRIVDMRQKDPRAICDGGDVLWTGGSQVFVGLSERTNQAAIQVLQDAFDDKTVIPVPFQGNALHLKSIVTHMDESTLLAPMGSLGDAVLMAMKAEEYYNVIRLPSMLACNVVAVNGGILAQDTGCAESKKLLLAVAQERGLQIEFLDCSEFAKCDGALTCCSLLLQI